MSLLYFWKVVDCEGGASSLELVKHQSSVKEKNERAGGTPSKIKRSSPPILERILKFES